MLPADKHVRVLGLPNRLFFAFAGSVFCVFVEVLLNSVGALTWEYAWWGARAPWLIFLIGYLPFFLVSFWVFDTDSIQKKVMTVGTILAVDIIGLVLFGAALGWI